MHNKIYSKRRTAETGETLRDANSRFALTSSGVVTLTVTLTRLENFLIT